ncbi:YciI family protein, partial [Pseudomonas aeruginosa]
AEELAAIVDECMTYYDQLGKAGHYIASRALQSVQTAPTLRHQGGRLAMTDGPFAATQEQLGGVYRLEARGLH